MPILLKARYQFDDLVVRFHASQDTPDAWSLCLVPADREKDIVTPRENLDAPSVLALPSQFLPMRAWDLPPLVGIHRRGDPLPGAFANGRTFLTSPTAGTFSVCEQTSTRNEENHSTLLRTVLKNPEGLTCIHEIEHRDGAKAITLRSTVCNQGKVACILDFASSFCLGGITPFATDDAAGRLHFHRFRSGWSAEARHEVQSLEALHLERSWSGHAVRVEHFGQSGSMPTNGWMPCAAIEDREARVIWAARLAVPGSWQIELMRRGDQVALAGGLADRNSGEWAATLQPGESIVLPETHLTVATGTIDNICARLNELQRLPLVSLPKSEQTMPILFNEWCTSWGAPTHDNLMVLADTLAAKTGSAVKYLVIDDGWAERPSRAFQQNGDWVVNRTAFPNGLRATANAIRARGFVPGIWFEFEAVNAGSKAWHETAHQLHRDGVPLQVGNRRYWDFRDPWVHDFLTERVTALLRDNHIGYLKIDHNDTLGPGIDGPDAPGENLRKHLACVQLFLRNLRQTLPELVIENCSSGGHRIEPSWMAHSAMGSFSDAHETPDIPLIAGNLLQHILPAQSQIWAVLRSTDTRQRLAYSLSATFLGRMCLSGDVQAINQQNWPLINESLALYQAAVPLIRDGTWKVHRQTSESWQHLEGFQIATAIDSTSQNLLIAWHRFGGTQQPVTHMLSEGGSWQIARQFGEHPALSVQGNLLQLADPREWTGGVALLTREVSKN